MTPDTESQALPETPEDAFRLQRSCARAFAIQFLYQLDVQKSWDCTPEELILFRENLGGLDKGFAKQYHRKAWGTAIRMIEGVCAHREEIDQLLSDAAANWDLFRMSGVDRSILRLGAYEIAFGGKVTPATAINEAVELAKKFGHSDSPRFINGVLDKVRRIRLAASSGDISNQ